MNQPLLDGRSETEAGRLVRQCGEALRVAFPLAFGLHIRPLQVGIHHHVHALIGASWGRRTIQRAVGRHVRQRAYLVAVLDHSQRIDLHGSVAGSVSAAARARARACLDAMDARGGSDSRGLAAKERASLLKRFRASSKTLEEFADLVEMDASDLLARMTLAEAERQARADDAYRLVTEWRESGKTKADYCKQAGLTRRKLEQALERCAARV